MNLHLFIPPTIGGLRAANNALVKRHEKERQRAATFKAERDNLREELRQVKLPPPTSEEVEQLSEFTKTETAPFLQRAIEHFVDLGHSEARATLLTFLALSTSADSCRLAMADLAAGNPPALTPKKKT